MLLKRAHFQFKSCHVLASEDLTKLSLPVPPLQGVLIHVMGSKLWLKTFNHQSLVHLMSVRAPYHTPPWVCWARNCADMFLGMLRMWALVV